MRIQSIQTNTNFQGLGHKLVRMQKMQEGQSVVQRFSENIMQESKSEITKEIKKPTKEWFDNWFNGYINQSAVAKKAGNVISELTPASKKILDTLSDSAVEESKGKKLNSRFVINTINYLINEAKPSEKFAIIDKMAKLPKINYNRVDENDISILEHILNAEDLQVLNLVNKTTLDYYPPLDYTYYQIKNEEFKNEVDKLNLNFKDLKKAVKSENFIGVIKRLDDFTSPFYKIDVQGKELYEMALNTDLPFFNSFTDYNICGYYLPSNL